MSAATPRMSTPVSKSARRAKSMLTEGSPLSMNEKRLWLVPSALAMLA
jgi:hypothetical protein